MVREHKPDAVIVDIMMPELNGHSLIIELRKDPATKHIPIMVVTGLTKGERRSPEEWRRVLDVEAFLQKPLKAEELLEAVKRVLLGKSA